MRSALRVAAKLAGPAVAITVLLVVFAKVPLALVSSALRHALPAWVGAAVAVSLVVQLVDAARLRRFTDAHRLGLSTWDLLQINLATQCYGLVLPGGCVSGIAIRCSQLPTNDRKVGAGVSLVADQVVLVAAMCTVGIAFWLVDYGARSLPSGATIVAVLCGALLILLVVLAPSRLAGVPRVRWLMTRWGDRVQALRDTLRPLSQLDRRGLLEIGALAVASQLLRILVYYLLVQALGLGVPLVTMGWIRSAMMVATMPPVSVSGLGLREGASLLLLSGYGIAPERIVAFSLSLFGFTTLFALLGGVLEVGRFAQALRVAARRMREERRATATSSA